VRDAIVDAAGHRRGDRAVARHRQPGPGHVLGAVDVDLDATER
jgi:hypothetical protein